MRGVTQASRFARKGWAPGKTASTQRPIVAVIQPSALCSVLFTPDQVNGQGRTNHSCNRPGGKSLCRIQAMKHMNAMPQAV
jgi:hypothetical protein